MKFVKLIYSDFKKYRKYESGILVVLFFTQGFWASFQYRIANALFYSISKNLLRKTLMFPMIIWQKFVEITTGISLPASARIGHSFYIGHFGGIILNANTVIGNNCNISQGVTIGVSGQGEKRGTPVIGDNVYIGANAVIAGKIIVGDNVLIAACSLVNRDVSDNSVVAGVPAHVLSEKSSEGYI